jgi:hypothetical protein
MPTTDIFIKTYHKDFVWLEYALRSIRKFASGFRDVVIVSDDDGRTIPTSLLEILPCKVFYVRLPEKQPSNPDHGIGYLWQQYIKLTWYRYSDADAAVMMDSDRMFTCPFTPESFHKDGKFYWYYRSWDTVGDGKCHKPSTDFFLGFNTPYEAMACPALIFTRSVTLDLESYMNKLHSTGDIWDIIIKHNIPAMSEFNIFGNFIHHVNSPDYSISYDVTKAYQNTMISSWSWGGLAEEDRARREKVLESK